MALEAKKQMLSAWRKKGMVNYMNQWNDTIRPNKTHVGVGRSLSNRTNYLR